MKIALLGGTKEDEIVSSLLEDILSLGVDCEFVHVNELQRVFGKDAVYAVRHVLNIDYKELSNKVRIINSFDSVKKAKDKIKTTEILEASHIPQPEYVLTKRYEEVFEFTKAKGQTIMKFPYGCAGKLHTILVHDNGALTGYTISGKFKVRNKGDHLLVGERGYFLPHYLVQEFISMDGSKTNDRVFRVYLTGNNPRFGTIRKKNNVNNLSDSIINIAQGAHYEFITDLDEEMKKLAVRTSEAVGFDCGVVDMLADKDGRYYVIECDCDGKFLMVDRKFMKREDYCDKFSFNKMIGKRLVEIAQGADYRK